MTITPKHVTVKGKTYRADGQTTCLTCGHEAVDHGYGVTQSIEKLMEILKGDKPIPETYDCKRCDCKVPHGCPPDQFYRVKVVEVRNHRESFGRKL